MKMDLPCSIFQIVGPTSKGPPLEYWGPGVFLEINIFVSKNG